MPTLKAGPGPTNLNPDDGPDQRELEDFTEPDRWNDPDDEPELDFAAGPRAAELLGFWSYVHKDDDVDMGRVTQLARDIVANYEAIKAEEIRLFLTATTCTGVIGGVIKSMMPCRTLHSSCR